MNLIEKLESIFEQVEWINSVANDPKEEWKKIDELSGTLSNDVRSLIDEIRMSDWAAERVRIDAENVSPKPTTVVEWFKLLPDGYRERALANMYGLNEIVKVPNMNDALAYAFSWVDTSDGFHFWEQVWEHYASGAPLPKLPK
jgi:hypothetical protein